MFITADEGTFYSYSSLPRRLIPPFYRKNKYPPYGVRKIETIAGAKVVRPESLENLPGGVLGVYVNDPLGMTEVSRGLQEVFGDPPFHVEAFRMFSERLRVLRRKFKVIVGGPGSWELALDPPDWVDTVFVGEAEETLPKLLRQGEFPKVVYGEKAKRFFPIKSPSSLSEVEVIRGERRVPMNVVKEELRVQSRRGRVNLISNDLFSYGEGLEVLLRTAKEYGEVYFSHITQESSANVDLQAVRKILGLNERNWRSPALLSKRSSCRVEEIEREVLKELNENFIYPTIYVEEEKVTEYIGFKSILIPLPSTPKYYEVLYQCWLHNRGLLRFKFARVAGYVLRKNAETKGEYLKRLNLRRNFFKFLLLLVRSYFSL
ncbi:MAG: hypothetical protein MPF33_02470 [Candidatus Aramenus sp.]|nr:hypothetical protein [Candidatus Aramenus sp.]